MKFKKIYDNIIPAFLDSDLPCHNGDGCSENCQFFPFMNAFDLSCAGFCANHPEAAAKILGVEIIDDENE